MRPNSSATKTEEAEARIVALLVDGKQVDAAEKGATVMVVANQTPFYGESGGQVGDTGTITIPGKATLTVTDTQKKVGDLVVHYATVDDGTITATDSALFTVDHERRSRLRAHHSATHLLFAAMRDQLGQHVSQKGSLVAPDRLRFDVSHPKQVGSEELRHLEGAVNAGVRANLPVVTRLMTPKAATEAGAIAEFGEKYGDEVRVVSMGEGAERITVDLCGGTHARRTGDIGLFKIIGEGAVGSGVRRIEAVTGAAAEAWIDQQVALLANAAEALKVPPAELPARLTALAESNRRLEKELTELRRKLATGEGGAAASPDRTINGIKLAARKLDGIPAKDLKGMADDIKKQIGSGVVALVSDAEGKASLVIAVTEDLAPKVSAVDLVRAGAAALGGKRRRAVPTWRRPAARISVVSTKRSRPLNRRSRSWWLSPTDFRWRHARPCAGMHVFFHLDSAKAWMAGTSPAMMVFFWN